MGVRDRVRAAWGELTKADGVQTSTNSLLLQAQANASMNLAGRSTASPPDQVVQAMNEQGLIQGGPFSPGQPIQQWRPWGDPPREFDYSTGYNIGRRPRTNEGRVSFETLASIIAAWDTARMCIEHIQDDLRSLDWRIVSSEDAEDDDVSADITAARKFMSKPDGYTPFDAWQGKLLEDILRFDAGAIYKHRLRGGKIGALEIVQGTTVAPLLDDRGGVPMPPAPAFVQYAQGVPWVWMTTDELIYQPFRPQPESPYGLPPVEWLLLTANTDIRFQWHFLNWFTEGTLPEAFMEAPPDTSDPEAVKKLQSAWDAVMEGDQAQKHKIRWVPAGSRPTLVPEKAFDDNFPLWLMRKCAAAFKITPSDLGYTEDVNRATSDTQMDVQFRIGTLPRVRHLEGIYNRVLQDDMGWRVKFEFDVGREKEDRLMEAQVHQAYVNMGAESPDEVRESVLGLPVDTQNPLPRFIVARTGIVPLRAIYEVAGDVDPQTGNPMPGSVEVLDPQHYMVPNSLPPPKLVPGEQAPPEMQGMQLPPGVIAPDGSLVQPPGAAGAAPAAPVGPQAAPAAAADAAPAKATPAAATLEDAQKSIKQELGRWRDNSRRRLRQGKPPRPFKSEILSPALHNAVWADLRKATSLDEVDAAFSEPEQRARLAQVQQLQDEIQAELARRL